MSATQVMFLPALICLLAALFKNCSTDFAKFNRMMARGPRRKRFDIGDNHVTLRFGFCLVAVKWGQIFRLTYLLKWRTSACGSIDANSDSLPSQPPSFHCNVLQGYRVVFDFRYVLTKLKGAVGPRWRYTFYWVPFCYLNGSTPCNALCFTKL